MPAGGGSGKRTDRKASTAPRVDLTPGLLQAIGECSSPTTTCGAVTQGQPETLVQECAPNFRRGPKGISI